MHAVARPRRAPVRTISCTRVVAIRAPVHPSHAGTAPAAPGGAKPPAGAKTIPLAKAPGGGPAVGKKTTPLQPTAGAVKPLPKVTVQLQKYDNLFDTGKDDRQ